VLASWRNIFAQPTAIECGAERVLRFGDTACVICHEALPGGLLVATNLFVREAGAWRLVHHQAGGVARGAATAAPGSATRLH
jgi:SnoaL-like domain